MLYFWHAPMNSVTDVLNAAVPETELVIEPDTGWLKLELGDLWRYRELLYFLVWRDIKVRYKQTALGAAWAILQPLLTMVVFSVFFGRLAQMPSEGMPYPLFTYTALLPWQLFAYALSESSNSLVANQNLITKVYFPRLVIPIARRAGGTGGFRDRLSGAAGDDGLLSASRSASRCSDAAALPAAGAGDCAGGGVVAFGAERAVPRCALHDPLPDPVLAVLTPIAYPAAWCRSGWRPLYALNPMAGVVEGFRWALLGTQNTPARGVLDLGCWWSLLLLVGGLVYFRRMENTFADVV